MPEVSTGVFSGQEEAHKMTWPTIPLRQRYSDKVDRSKGPDSCHPWIGATAVGYGRIAAGGKRGLVLGAHRLTYELFIGPIPDGLWVLHRCDNRRCCNPSHLFLGTHLQNMRDMRRKGRSNRGGRNPNAKLLDSDVLVIWNLKGKELQRVTARKFGVTRQAVGDIQSGRGWGWLEKTA
jgi:hypothetical protein